MELVFLVFLKTQKYCFWQVQDNSFSNTGVIHSTAIIIYALEPKNSNDTLN